MRQNRAILMLFWYFHRIDCRGSMYAYLILILEKSERLGVPIQDHDGFILDREDGAIVKSSSDENPLDLIEGDLVGSAVVDLGGAGDWCRRVRSWLAGIMRTKGERDRVMGSGMGTG